MTSKDLRDEKTQQRENLFNPEPGAKEASPRISRARETIPTGRSVAERLPRKSDKLRPRTHGGVIRQLIEQGMAQLAEDKTALDAIQRRIDRTQQSMQNLKGLLEDWEESTQLPPEESK